MKISISKKNISIILSIFTVFLCIATAVFILAENNKVSYASDEQNVNTLDYVADESVYIPEPEENIGKAPDHTRWEPMLGIYVVKEMYYDPETRSFMLPEDWDIAEGTETEDNENIRIEAWLEVHSASESALYAGLIAYEKSKLSGSYSENYNPLSSIRLVSDSTVVNQTLIPLGVSYLDGMLDLVMNQKLFDVPLSYSIEQITGVVCQPEGMAYDDYEWTHDQWRANMKALLAGVETAVENGESADAYGLFALPYLVRTDPDALAQFLTDQPDLMMQNGFSMDQASDPAAWAQDNAERISSLKDCVEKYK